MSVNVNFATLFHLYFKIINFLIRFHFRSHRRLVNGGYRIFGLFSNAYIDVRILA